MKIQLDSEESLQEFRAHLGDINHAVSSACEPGESEVEALRALGAIYLAISERESARDCRHSARRIELAVQEEAEFIGLGSEDPCEDPECAGWCVLNQDLALWPDGSPVNLGDIQRCDLCRVFEDDSAAIDAARAAGFEVDDDGAILSIHREV